MRRIKQGVTVFAMGMLATFVASVLIITGCFIASGPFDVHLNSGGDAGVQEGMEKSTMDFSSAKAAGTQKTNAPIVTPLPLVIPE